MVSYKQFKERELHKEQRLLILSAVPLAFLIYGLVMGAVGEKGVVAGILDIVQSPTTLLTDFLEVGGIGASFVNAALVGFFNIYLLKHYKMRINGLLVAAVFTVIGFSFFGKNILNIMPIYLGGYLYAKYQGIPMKNVILVVMFSTALAPLVSEITYGGIFHSGFNYVMGIVVGIAIGFIIVPLSSHMLRFHDGYNLYNIGFTAGIIGTVFTSFMRNFNINIEAKNILYLEHNVGIVVLFAVVFVYLILVGLWINKEGLIQYRSILKYKGRTITDFPGLVGYGITFINMGIMGLLSLGFVLALGGIVNGPVIAGIMTIVGFGAFGKHPKNCFPIVLGVLLGGFFFGYDFSSTGFIISALFSTTIAPIAGQFGPVVGVIAGILHLTVVTNIGVVHGGINLYNNGFSGGMVAAFMLPIIDAFKRGDD
ncbi:DUF1576 domain-containing protein [Fusibacter tunisiensis]|uniref:DUF1576 domain-containing protein n=1 Tax=Fusibacter tunisiensis TaxID=1008308 RepID=A0ABS2MNE4_9FIRM|nr:hypothetical protein [Fusibacter tunisiensis]